MSQSTAMRLSLIFGIVYLLVGVLGFIPGITVEGERPGQGLLLGIFAVNAVHNVAHLGLGAALVWAGTNAELVRSINRGLAVVFALLVVASLIAPIVEGVAINPPDTGLHLGSMLLTAAIGWLAERRGGGLASSQQRGPAATSSRLNNTLQKSGMNHRGSARIGREATTRER